MHKGVGIYMYIWDPSGGSHGIRLQQVPINGWSSSFGGVFLHTTPQLTTTAEGGEDLLTLRWEREMFVGVFSFVCVCDCQFFGVELQMFICICIFQMG